MKYIATFALFSSLALSAAPSYAVTHTWLPRATVQGTGPGDVQTVVITGSNPSIQFGPGNFDVAFEEVPIAFQGGNGIANAIASGTAKAAKLAHACTNPLIGGDLQSVTGGNDTTDRWLAAQAMYNIIESQNLLPMYGRAFNGISIIIGGVKFSGFKVWYHDGASETWAINPSYATSVVKLIDTPMPGSLTGPSAKDGC